MIPTEISRVVACGALFCILIVVGLTLTLCHSRDDTRQAQAGETFADSRTQAAQDASEIRDAADEAKAELDQTVKEATDAIRNAPDPDSRNRAAELGLCRIEPRSSPNCPMLLAHP